MAAAFLGSATPTLADTPGRGLSSSPNTGATQYNTLEGIACPAGKGCWAVGYAGDSASSTLVEHYDGTAWRLVSSPHPGTGHLTLGGGVLICERLLAAGYYAIGSEAVTGELIDQTGTELSMAPRGQSSAQLTRARCRTTSWSG
jgi:hypothetical protein